PPSVPHPSGVFDHRRGVPGDALAMKGGLRQPSLAQMKFAFAGQQPFAEQSLRALQPLALHKCSVVRDQRVADVIGVVEQEDRLRAELEINKIAVSLGQIGQKFDRIAADCEEIDAGKNWIWTWGKN